MIPSGHGRGKAKRLVSEYLAIRGKDSTLCCFGRHLVKLDLAWRFVGCREGGYLFGMPTSLAYSFGGWWVSILLFVPLIKRLKNVLPGALTHVYL